MRRCGIVILLLIIMVGCAGAPSGSRNKESQARFGEIQSRLQPLYGEWFGQRGGSFGMELLRVVLNKDNSVLQTLSGPITGSADLVVSKVDSMGIVFTFRPVLSNLPTGEHSVVPGLSTGLVRISPKGEQLLLEFPTASGTLAYGAVVSHARVPKNGKEIFLSSADGIIYTDWQTRGYNAGETISRNTSRDRLEQVFLQLRSQGNWQCLSQRTLTTSQQAGSLFSNDNRSLSSRLYLIYAPEGNGTLAYSIFTKGYVGLHGQSYDYPIFISENNTTTTFVLRPDNSKERDSLKPIPVSLFVFGRHTEGQESKCSLSGL